MNSVIQRQGTTVTMDSFSGFLGGGAGIRSVIRGRIVFDAVWERFGRSQVIGGASARNEIQIPVTSYQFSLGWDFLKSKRDMRFGLAAGVGYYDSQAKQILSEGRNREEYILGTVDMSGSGWGSHYKLFFETAVSEKVFLYTEATWRVAKVTGVEFSGLESIEEAVNEQSFVAVPIAETVDANGNVVPPDSPDVAGTQFLGGGNELDWSGFEGRIGFVYYFNTPSRW